MNTGRAVVVALTSAGISLVAVVAAFLYLQGGSNFQLFLIVAILALAGGATAAVFARTGAPEGLPTDHEGQFHPGISLHAIPVAGTMGGVFALGYLVMFWFGVPGWRPLVVALLGVGALSGAALIITRSRRAAAPPDEKPLHLDR